MSVMSFREPNQVLWRGVRPAHNGTQITKWTSATNADLLIHTVTAGKVFYLQWAAVLTASDTTGLVYVHYRDLGDITVLILAYDYVIAGNDHPLIANNFNPPIEIPAGYDLTVVSTAVGLSAQGYILGWEE